MYFYLLVDDYSIWCSVYFIKNKFEAFAKFQSFHALMERQTGIKLKAVRSDRGREFSSNEFLEYCDRFGIKRKFTTLYSP